MTRGMSAAIVACCLFSTLLLAAAQGKPGNTSRSLTWHGVRCLGEGGNLLADGSVSGQLPLAINHLEGCAYAHHPVMLEVPAGVYPVDRRYITEWNGLKVPAGYDCDIFNNGKHWGPHHYFYEVHTRWHACWLHYGALKSGNSLAQPSLPLVDDEYNEHVAVYQSALRARTDQPYVVAEWGARWGTWGSRAAAFFRALRPHQPYSVHFFEVNKVCCEGIRKVMAVNKLSPYVLQCEPARADNARAWLVQQQHVDLIDMDVQGAELEVVRATVGLLDEKVYRLVIGTHSVQIHAALSELLIEQHEWIPIFQAHPLKSKEMKACTVQHVRGMYKEPPIPARFNWTEVLRKGCYTASAKGAVATADGELILDNPRFVHRDRKLSPYDKVLRVDDLIINDPAARPEMRAGARRRTPRRAPDV